MERETGIEPATNSLEGCDSTIELLPRSYQSNTGKGSSTAFMEVLLYARTSCLIGDFPKTPVRIASAATAVKTPFHL